MMFDQDKINFSYESLWKAIIRPPKDNYTEEELGQKDFSIYGRSYHREDYDLIATKGNLLKCSFIQPFPEDRISTEMPLVIYLHGNSSSRIEGLKYMIDLLKRGINLFVFDFAGCGRSDGEYISLGYYESADLRVIVDFVSKLPGVSKIGIWGRSMGAATGLIYSHTDKRVCCVCVDSPFSSFQKLAKELCTKQIKVPEIIMNTVISILRNTIMKKHNFDIMKLNPIDDARVSVLPIFFVHAMKDDLISLAHTIELYSVCPSKDKTLNVCDGGHNTPRQYNVINKICNFFESFLVKEKAMKIARNKTKIK